jgi:hypothetical protein
MCTIVVVIVVSWFNKVELRLSRMTHHRHADCVLAYVQRYDARMLWLPLLLSLQVVPAPMVTITIMGAKASPPWSTTTAAPLPPRCTACHGTTGLGDGPAGLGITPPMPSFSDVWWQTARTDEQLSQVIRSGGKALGMSPLMPAFPGFNDVEVAALIGTIRSLAKPGTAIARISMTGQPNRFVAVPTNQPMTVPTGSRVLIRTGLHSCDVTATTDTTCTLAAPGTTP